MKEILQQAQSELSKICKDPAKFLMSKPAQPTDSDMAIQAALTKAEEFLEAVVRMRQMQRDSSRYTQIQIKDAEAKVDSIVKAVK